MHKAVGPIPSTTKNKQEKLLPLNPQNEQKEKQGEKKKLFYINTVTAKDSSTRRNTNGPNRTFWEST